ncbi:acetoin utilization protein AcuC [Rhodovulum sp. YNF3179]|uniref:acetoin utilization protein AcuC n=1 Tax=Rhodovulum sp. YNF3179 TaxID=3425127 RepID=UPI003D354242
MTAAPLFIGSEIYRGSSYGTWHPLAIPRVPTVMDLARALGWLPRDRYVASPRAKPAALAAFHTPGYLAALQDAERTQSVSDQVRARHHLGTHSNPVYPEVFRRPATAAGGSILAAELLRDGGVVYNPGGGTHHGLPDRANGFCYLNDPVLALKAFRAQGIRRLAYVDVDAHHCDGVEMAFDGDPEIRMISVHEERRWPFTGALQDRAGGAARNMPVPAGLNDSEMDAILDGAILPLVADFRPEAVVLQCGADALAEDPLSRLTLSNGALWRVVAALRPLAPRFLVLGGGGYNPWSVGRAWTGVWATLAGHEIPDRLPGSAQAVLRALNWSRARSRPPAPSLMETLADAPRPGPIRPEIRTRIAAVTA